ncbi:MAG: nitroreductase family protein [Duncaniella sp.]|nr:nitroreductase family protein [Duncaniella sp.]
MKSVKDTLLERRSIRRYEREVISDEHMALIYDAIRNTPTSYNGQQYSVVEVIDQTVKEKLYDLTGQKQIKTCNRFLLFLADYHKISLLAESEGITMPAFNNTVDGLLVSVIDASLAMMSAITMAESLGLGCCPIGYARTAAPEAISNLLELPEKTFVVCGLAIGIPREQPDLKPKQPVSLVVHKNHYRHDDSKMVEELSAYNEDVIEYNRTRAGEKSVNDWVSHIVDYYSEAMGYHALRALQRRGFDLQC